MGTDPGRLAEQEIFFQYLHLSPKDRRIIVCESVYSSTQFRKALAFVLFKLFSAPAVCFVLELVLPLYLTGLHSGLVVDLGYDAARVLPTFAGVPLLSAYSAAACGVRRVLQGIKGALGSLSSEERKALEDETVLEDVLVCACYVSCDFPEDSEFAASSFRTDKDAEVRLVGRDHGLRVPAACRDIGLFFKSDKDATREDGCECETLPEAFVRALELSPVDLRSQLVQNIVVCGGAANLRGLLPRLALELQKALEDHKALGALAEKLRFTPMDFAPVSAAWTGGAIFGALEGVADYSAEDFHKGEPLPDWLRSGFL
ncbi:unnamed protein product [Effrenium voratum]|nr:unnamed protein product [Effrenium voratum]